MKKINYGLVLIVITIVILSIFITLQNNIKQEDKENVEGVIKEYINLQCKYAMLEEKNRDINKVISNEEYNKYLDEVKYELSQYVIDESIDSIFERFKMNLDSQLDGKYMLNNYSKNFVSIKEFNTNDEYIFVIFESAINVDKDNRFLSVKNEKTGRYEGEITHNEYKYNFRNTIIFKKVDGKYMIMHDSIGFEFPEGLPMNPNDLF